MSKFFTKRGFLRTALITLTAVLFSSVSFAGATLDRVLDSGKLRVAMSGDQPPFNVKSRNGKMIGYDVDLANAFADTMQVELEVVQMPFGDLAAAVEKGKADMAISGMAITSGRTQKLSFVGPYNVSGKSILTTQMVMEKNKESGFNSDGNTLLALEKSTSKAFAERNFPNAKLKTIKDYDEGIQMILLGKADALVADMTICKLSVLRNPDAELVTSKQPLSIEPIGVAINKDDEQFENLTRNYLSTFEKMGITKALQKKWFESNGWIAALP